MPNVNRIRCSECTELMLKVGRDSSAAPMALFTINLTMRERDSETGTGVLVEQEAMNVCGVHYALLMREMDLANLMELHVTSTLIEAGPL